MENYSFIISEKTKSTYNTIVTVFFWIGLFVTAYVLGMPLKEDGSQFFFTIPLTFSICCFIFKDIVSYSSGGMALKVFFTVCVFRYLVLPFFTCQQGHFNNVQFSANAYIYATFVEDMELIVSCVFIRHYYKKEYRRISKKALDKQFFYEDLSLGGLLVIVFSIGIVAVRGLGELTQYMRVGIVTEGMEAESMGYDIWLAQTVLAFLMIVVASYYQKKNDIKSSFGNMLLPLFVGMLTCVIIFGNNRMTIVYYALSAIAILNYAFPSKSQKSVITAIMAIVFAVIMISFTMTKQFSVDVSTGNMDIGDRSLTGSVALYISSTEAIAKTYDLYGLRGDQMQGLLTFFSDVAHKTQLFFLPQLNFIKSAFRNIPTSYGLAMTDVEVCPMAGQMLFFGGYWFGWLFDILAFYTAVRCMIIFEVKSKTEKRLGIRYLSTWVSIVFAMMMCYHMGIIYNVVTYIPLFTYLALIVNDKIKIKKTRIR